MPAFSLEQVEASFRRLAGHLKILVVAYVLGGAAMARLRVKASTKDVDIVFRTVEELEAFEAALQALDARRIHEPPTRGARPGARHLWETPDGMAWDLFVGNVIGFQFVPSDFNSATEWLQEANLDIRQLSPNLVFVMKAFTPRTRNIADMADLLSSGAATAPGVEALVAVRLTDTQDHDWLARFYHGVIDMGKARGIDVRWVDRFDEPASDAAAVALIREWLVHESLTTETLAKKLEMSPEQADSLLLRLEKKRPYAACVGVGRSLSARQKRDPTGVPFAGRIL